MTVVFAALFVPFHLFHLEFRYYCDLVRGLQSAGVHYIPNGVFGRFLVWLSGGCAAVCVSGHDLGPITIYHLPLYHFTNL